MNLLVVGFGLFCAICIIGYAWLAAKLARPLTPAEKEWLRLTDGIADLRRQHKPSAHMQKELVEFTRRQVAS